MSLFCTMLAFVESLLCSPGGVVPAAWGPVPEAADMRLFATSYNPALGGINCDDDCSTVAIGLRSGPHLEGQAAACPSEWLGLDTTTVIILADGSEWYCVDAFGAPVNRKPVWLHLPYYHEANEYEMVWRVDFLVTDPASFEFNQELLAGWHVEWRPIPEEWQ